MKTNKKETNFSLIARAVKLLMKICPKYMIWSIILSVVEIISPYFNLYMSAQIINELATDLNKNEILILVIITLVGNIALSILNKLMKIITQLLLKLELLRPIRLLQMRLIQFL